MKATVLPKFKTGYCQLSPGNYVTVLDGILVQPTYGNSSITIKITKD